MGCRIDGYDRTIDIPNPGTTGFWNNREKPVWEAGCDIPARAAMMSFAADWIVARPQIRHEGFRLNIHFVIQVSCP
jgi:hypothetical protein